MFIADKPKVMFVCDRCKKTFVYFNDDKDNIFLQVQPRSTVNSYAGYKAIYLCPKCTKDFDVYMNEIKEDRK